MRGRPLVGCVLALASVACTDEPPARDQWLVTISTHANVPQFGDRVLVEVHPEIANSCEACRRLFDAAKPEDWPLRLGILASSQEIVIRARLLRSELLGTEDAPGHGLVLDAALRLPPASGVTAANVRLSMDCFGVDANLAEGLACSPGSGALVPFELADAGAAFETGSWSKAASIDCSRSPPAGMVCVPGGAFILGDATRADMADPADTPVPEHVVIVPPFFLDKEELSVRDLRDLANQHPELPMPVIDPSTLLSDFCSFDASGANDDLPANCFDWATAEAYCKARAARLPTEAEWEFAAGNLGKETLFPWGDANDICKYAIVERSTDIESRCRLTDQGTLPAGPTVEGGPLDYTELGVHDLAGSVSEWVADTSQPYDGPCWSAPGALVDPVCTGDGSASIRGASFADLGIDARAMSRRHAPRTTKSGGIGVRCAAD